MARPPILPDPFGVPGRCRERFITSNVCQSRENSRRSVKPGTARVVVVAHDVDAMFLSHPLQFEAQPLLLKMQSATAEEVLGSPTGQSTEGEANRHTKTDESCQVMRRQEAEKSKEDLQEEEPSRLDR